MARHLVPDDDPNAERLGDILAGACAAFSRKGFASTSMREIAEASGASLGSIYYHFPCKDDILRAIICGNFRLVMEKLDEKLEGVKDPRRKLHVFVENHVAFFAKHLDEMRVMAHELDTLRGEPGKEVAALRRAYTQRAQKILAALRPDLARQDVHVASLALFGMVNWAYRWFHTLPSDVDVPRLGRRMAALFLDGYLDRRTVP
jgi:AcrR family transcriptional regulator